MTMRFPRRVVDWIGRGFLVIGNRLATPVPAEYQCDIPGCQREGDCCYYPDDGDVPSHLYCRKHARGQGFCFRCGMFWGGVESFHFDPDGLCDNCRAGADITGTDDEDDSDAECRGDFLDKQDV